MSFIYYEYFEELSITMTTMLSAVKERLTKILW